MVKCVSWEYQIWVLVIFLFFFVRGIWGQFLDVFVFFLGCFMFFGFGGFKLGNVYIRIWYGVCVF